MAEINNTEDLIDSRDVIERIKELEAQDKDEQEAEELAALKELNREGEDTFGEEWEYGVTLVHEDYFEDYAQEFAEDIGAIDRNAQWPLQYIDWEEAADALKMDYSEVDFDGQAYYGR